MTEFFCPTKIWSGSGSLERLKTLHAKRVLIVTDAYFSGSGSAKAVGARISGAEVRIFDQVRPDPPAALAAEGAAICKQFAPDLLIALGGGSVMDCAKAIRFASDVQMEFYAVPTTSGSGSEVTSFSVLTHGDAKYPLIDPLLRPDVAILDDTLLQNLPQALIADTGFDVLTHCIEALGSQNRNAFSDALAMAAAETVFSSLEASFSGDLAVRGNVHEAATMAGMAFDHAGLGLCHAMAHGLGGVTHLPHGRLCAMLLPHVMQVNSASALCQYARLARFCGVGAATDQLSLRGLQRLINRLRTAVHMPATWKEAGIELTVTDTLLDVILEDPCCKSNPVPVTKDMIFRVLKAVAE